MSSERHTETSKRSIGEASDRDLDRELDRVFDPSDSRVARVVERVAVRARRDGVAETAVGGRNRNLRRRWIAVGSVLLGLTLLLSILDRSRREANGEVATTEPTTSRVASAVIGNGSVWAIRTTEADAWLLTNRVDEVQWERRSATRSALRFGTGDAGETDQD